MFSLIMLHRQPINLCCTCVKYFFFKRGSSLRKKLESSLPPNHLLAMWVSLLYCRFWKTKKKSVTTAWSTLLPRYVWAEQHIKSSISTSLQNKVKKGEKKVSLWGFFFLNRSGNVDFFSPQLSFCLLSSNSLL